MKFRAQSRELIEKTSVLRVEARVLELEPVRVERLRAAQLLAQEGDLLQCGVQFSARALQCTRIFNRRSRGARGRLALTIWSVWRQ